MIVFDLKCSHDHIFEAWFSDSDAFEGQVLNNEVQCPVCGDSSVEKAPMAPNISAGTGRGRGRSDSSLKTSAGEVNAKGPGPSPEQVGEAIKTLRKMRDVIEKNFDYVGEKFPEEARKIHHGEVEKHNIYGDATKEETDELREEGIDVTQMPWLPRHDS